MNCRMGSDLNGSDRGGSTNHSGNHLSNNSPSKCWQILCQRSSSHQFTLSGSPTHYTRGMGNLTTSHLNIFISRENEESPKLFFSSSSNFFVFCHLQVCSWRGRTQMVPKLRTMKKFFPFIMTMIRYNKDYCSSNIWKVVIIPISNFLMRLHEMSKQDWIQ